MPDLENLLREELQHEAQKVQPELLRPLQVPTRQPSWRPRLLPFAAAAAVIAVITAGALVAGLPAPTSPPPTSPPSPDQPRPACRASTSRPAPAPAAAGYRRWSARPPAGRSPVPSLCRRPSLWSGPTLAVPSSPPPPMTAASSSESKEARHQPKSAWTSACSGSLSPMPVSPAT
jgi:hypothetical protein